MPFETREIKLFWRDVPGFCRDIPGVPEKFEKKKVWVQFSFPIGVLNPHFQSPIHRLEKEFSVNKNPFSMCSGDFLTANSLFQHERKSGFLDPQNPFFRKWGSGRCLGLGIPNLGPFAVFGSSVPAGVPRPGAIFREEPEGKNAKGKNFCQGKGKFQSFSGSDLLPLGSGRGTWGGVWEVQEDFTRLREVWLPFAASILDHPFWNPTPKVDHFVSAALRTKRKGNLGVIFVQISFQGILGLRKHRGNVAWIFAREIQITESMLCGCAA